MSDFSDSIDLGVREILSHLKIVPSKKLGQNFLLDKNMANSIVKNLDCQAEEVIIEIGAGLGALSDYLVDIAHHLILIEYDSRLVSFLKKRFRGKQSVKVIHTDATKISPLDLGVSGNFKLIGNFPYSCGSQILSCFLQESKTQRAVCMFQKEFANRLVACPKTKDYGAITLLVNRFWNCEIIKKVSPSLFFPRPKVDSVVVSFSPRFEYLERSCPDLFSSLVKKGFSQRRKKLKNLLPSFSRWQDLTHHLQVYDSVRAEELNLEQWLDLTRWFQEEIKSR